MSNRLANASSPYLRMHADNPVDWQPWDDAALKQARDTDTPILLSIGYSACHWCHVMAHECFENPDIAATMNQAFVAIKLDREQRPDIDHIYQLAHQAMNGRGGGWPLTVFLDPQDLSPFYIGTYFPPAPRHGLPGFPEVLRQVRAYFDTHRDQLREHADALQKWMQSVEAVQSDAVLASDDTITIARQRLAARFDPEWGGNSGAPKFPRAAELEWLLDQADFPEAHTMAHLTLRMMATRGLQDHLGGGFFRYCVDASWTIPHFEKMLYDNAQLLPVYARAAVAADTDARLRDVASAVVRDIVTWLARDMTAPDGGFYSALCADSAGAEGQFYLWTRDEVHAASPPALHDLADRAFGLDQPPNFEGRVWHLLRSQALDEIPWPPDGAVGDVKSAYMALREHLFHAREAREHPVRDDKVLTAWNALMISGLARTARLLDDTQCADMAQRALDNLRQSAWIDGELFANVAEPAARIPEFLDDHAFLLDALLETMQLEFNTCDLDWAVALADTLCDQFADRQSGGFWFSMPRHQTPLARNRSWTDDSLPSGNGVAIRALLRLGHLLGETRYLDVAEKASRASAGALHQYPDACPSLLRALEAFERPRLHIVMRSPQALRPTWQASLREALRSVDMIPGSGSVDAYLVPDTAGTLPGLLSARDMRGSAGTAWICSGLTCQAPVVSADALADALRVAMADNAVRTDAQS